MPATIDTVPEEEVAEAKLPPPPLYVVVLHNDDHNTMDFVVMVLKKVFFYTTEQCVKLMLEAHEKERAAVWSGTQEVAEFKADQMLACGADPQAKAAQPLRVTVEPAA
jgi:ATP-dependent Clp protease adaptor protein ClpS